MKKFTIIWSAVCVLLFAAVCTLGALYLSLTLQKEDFSAVYVSYMKTYLNTAEKERGVLNGSTLYLNTDYLTQTDSGHLIEQMRVYAQRYGMTLETCGREEAAAKGLIELNEEGLITYAGNCICLTVGDSTVSDTQIAADVSYYISGQGAHGCSLMLERIDGNWIVTDEKAYIS